MRIRRKVKKVLLIILVIILIGIISLVVFFNYQKNKNILNEKFLIVAKKSFNDYKYLDNFKDYLFVVKDGKMGVIDQDNNIKIDFIYSINSLVLKGNNAFIINDNKKNYLYNQDLNLINTFDEDVKIVKDVINEEDFYYLNGKLYNLKNEEVYKFKSDYFEKAGDYIFTDDNIINIKDNTKIKVAFFSVSLVDNGKTFENIIYAVSKDENTLYLFDSNKNLKEYTIIEKNTNSYLVQDDENQEYTFNGLNGLIKKDSVRKVLNYEFNYTSCSSGFKVYKENGKKINDICYENYLLTRDALGILLNKDNQNYLLYNDEIKENKLDGFITGKYLTAYSQEDGINLVYDLENEEDKNSTCYSYLDYIGNNYYNCNDGAKSYLTNDQLKKVTDYYDELTCLKDSPYCIFKKDKKYGLLMNSEVVIKASYDNLFFTDDNAYIIGEKMWNFDVFYLKQSQNYLKKNELEIESYKPYEDINVTDLINKYNLDKYKDVIRDNEELFKKYAYIVEHNPNLANYKNKVMDLFYEIGLNKEYLDESYFLTSLKQLNMIKKDTLDEEGYVGLYYDDDKRIELLSEENNVVYHELTHFVDYSFNSGISNNVYKCDDEYLSDKEFSKLNAKESFKCELIIMEEPNFLIEGGAEYYSGSYLNNNVLRTYSIQTNIIGALSYLFGYDKINDIYFDAEKGSYNLFMLFHNAGINEQDYINFLDITNRFHTFTTKDYFTVCDTLIKIYESIKDTPWYEDKEFREIITMIIGYNKVSDNYTEKYEEYQKLDFNFNKKYQKVIGDNYLYLAKIPGDYLKANDASYLIFHLYDKEYNYYYEVIEYDFETDTILNALNVKP